MRKILKPLFSVAFLATALFAVTAKNTVVAAEGTYYANADTSSGSKLINSLTTIINSGTDDQTYKELLADYKKTDCKPGTNIIWDMYSNEEFVCGGPKENASYKKEGDGYNREHSIPQSWFSEALPMKADLFHVYPTDGYVNNRRSNYPYGETNGETYKSKNGSKLGSSTFAGYSGTVFEPIDEYKGDFARTYFYMATRYRTKVGSWGSGASVVFKGTYPYLTDYAVKLFTKWSHEDPVSEKETKRNDAVYSIQKNRNPYIDHPEWIDMIWENSNIEVEADQAKVDACIAKINQIPATVTLDDETLVNAANSLYIALNYKEKKLVTNYATLTSALAKIDELRGTTPVVPPVLPIATGDTLTYDMPTEGSGYADNVTVTVDGASFLCSSCYEQGDFRLGSNKEKGCNSAFTVSDTNSSSLMMQFDIENAAGFTVNASGSYGTINKIYFYFSADQGKTWKQVGTSKETSGAISVSLDSPQTGRFAFVIGGSKPRLVIDSLEITVQEGENPEIAKVKTGLALGVDYKLKDNTVTETTAKVIVSAQLPKVVNGATYYVQYSKADGSNAKKEAVTISNNTIKTYLTIDAADTYIYNIICDLDGKTYTAKSITYSIKNMCQYYLDNDLITDATYKLVIEYLAK